MIESWITPTTLFVSLCLSMIGLFMASGMEQAQIIMKYFGAARDRVAWGYSLAAKVMVFNRLGAVLFYLFIGFSIDAGIGAQTLIKAFAIAFFGLMCANFALCLWFWRRELQHLGRFTSQPEETRLALASGIAGAFNLLGFSVPFIFGAIFPDFRLTLANMSFLFNTIFTLLIVFYIEDRFAKLIDQKSERVPYFVVMVMGARAPASGLIALSLLLALPAVPS